MKFETTKWVTWVIDVVDIYLSRTVKASLARLVKKRGCLQISGFPHLEFGFKKIFFISDSRNIGHLCSVICFGCR